MIRVSSLLLLAQLGSGYDTDGCTSIIVGKGATVDGSVMTSHSNDCQDCDWRMVYIPAKDHAPGAQRTIYDGSWGQYPRLVDPERAAAYQPGAGITASTIVGQIPQVNHTYALWESSYALMNEHGLALGESTCAANLVGNSTKDGGNDLLAVRTLMSLALERCASARCAIQTMGDLGAQYGFYGEDPGMAGGGEAVTVVDAVGEAWVFHITGGVPAAHPDASWAGQRGALWAAQRVPDGDVAVVPNTFIIRGINPDDPDNFMLHPGLFDLAQEAGLWDGRASFDFYESMQPDPRTFGLKPIPMYGTLRAWGVMRHAAPSAGYPLNDDLRTFPFSTPVDRKVRNLDVFNWFREHYEGTEYDMETGILAGPWQSPNRAEGGLGMQQVPGQFARAISIARTSYTAVLQSGIPQPVAWFAPDAPASSVFVPFFASVARNGGAFAEEEYGQGSMKSFSFSAASKPAWWAFDFVANYMEGSYRNMSRTYVYPAVHDLQLKVMNETQFAVAAVASADSDAAVGAALGQVQTQIQRHVTQTWWSLAEMLVVRYNDMSFNFPDHAPQQQSTIGYPAFWLEMIGFNNDYWMPKWVQPAEYAPSLLPAADKAALALPEKPSEGMIVSPVIIGSSCIVLSGVLAAGVMIGYRLGHRDGSKVADSNDSPFFKLGH